MPVIDSATAARIRNLTANAPFMQTLGMRITEIGRGWVTSEITIDPTVHHQQNGYIHAGVQASLADHSAGCAAATLVDENVIVLTIEFKVNLLRPAIGELLICRAEVLRGGRNVTVVESSVWVVRDEAQKLVSKATVTIANVK